MTGTVLVTGAGGFVGRASVAALRARGRTVIAGFRRPPPGERALDVLDPAALAAAMQGVETVVHTAVGGPRDTRVIVEGTRNTLAAACAAGVQRFIQLSSVAVYGAVEGVIDEGAPIDRPHGAYGAAKVAAEETCRTAAGATAVAILRPTLIYGPGSAQWTTPYLDRLRDGRWPALGAAGQGDANLVHVDDLAGFITHLATAPAAIAGTFNVNGADIPTWDGYLEALRVAIAAPPPTGRLPGSTTLAARKLAKAIVATGRAPAPLHRFVARTPSHDELVRFRTPVRYAIRRMLETGYRPTIDVATAVAGIADWERAGRP
ncbi:NAD-dependent epimerase/dehydratase family protein [Sphingomonas endophytica]|uniref:NAD-dependent epimerase/dehydratase family protein n=1 Tax=Sphingomonas endophytica TaxID=869719 RepID=UPI000A52A8C6|nr:NAD-dependent epimerase/dehydratase family protein [Sphingomonas endophytica]